MQSILLELDSSILESTGVEEKAICRYINPIDVISWRRGSFPAVSAYVHRELLTFRNRIQNKYAAVCLQTAILFPES